MVLCQCPERGDPHFYTQVFLKEASSQLRCVNALKGATLISTNSGKITQTALQGAVSMP